jgi:hypothetical protein
MMEINMTHEKVEKNIEPVNTQPLIMITDARMSARHPCIRFAKQSIENKGGKHGS